MVSLIFLFEKHCLGQRGKGCTRKIPLPSLSVSMIKFRRLFLKIDHICPLIFMKLIKSCSLFRWNKLPAKQKHNLCSSAQQKRSEFHNIFGEARSKILSAIINDYDNDYDK